MVPIPRKLPRKLPRSMCHELPLEDHWRGGGGAGATICLTRQPRHDCRSIEITWAVMRSAGRHLVVRVDGNGHIWPL